MHLPSVSQTSTLPSGLHIHPLGQRGILQSVQRRFFAVGETEAQHSQAASLALSVFIRLSACPKSSRKSSHLHPLTGLHH